MATAKKPSTTTKKEAVNTTAEPTTPEVKYAEVEAPIVARGVDLHQYVTVRNGFHGTLVYKSKKTGESYVWDEHGSEQEMELIELKDAKNTNKKMFINNWFMFDESWIIDYLGLRQYYKNAISIEDFDNIFTKSPEELRSIIGEMSDGQKHSAAYRARALINNGTIDSRKVIATLEEVLKTELIEK